MSNPLTLTQFAKEIGLTRGRISQLVPEGLPVRKDGKINLTRGKRWIERNLDPQRREAAGKNGTKPNGKLAGVAAARAKKLELETALAELEFKRRSSEMIDRKAAEAAVFGRARFERDAWTGWAARSAQALAADLDADPEKVFELLDRMVRDHLRELAGTPWEIAHD